jgi:hypothetical protein
MKLVNTRIVNAKVLVAACVMCVSAFAASSVIAQPGGGGGGFGGPGGGMRMGGGMMGGMMGGGDSVISENQLEKYAKIAGMNEDQTQAATMLHEGYQAQVRELQDAMRSKMEAARDAFRESGDPSEFQAMREEMTKVRADRKKLDTSFMNDVKALLTDEQAAKWVKVEMAMNRDQLLRRGMLSGERVDLFRLVDDLELAEESRKPVDELLSQYEVDLDRELVKRDAFTEKVITQMDELREDPAKAQAMLEEGRTAGVRVRDVNRRYARQIADMLPAESKAAFDTAFQRESFPTVYRESSVTRGVNAAMGFDDLTEEQRGKLQEISAKYAREAATLNEKLAKAEEENEMTMTAERMMGGRRGGGDGEETPLQLARQERRELDRKTNEALREVLTESQREKLPRNEMRGGRGGEEGQQRPRRPRGEQGMEDDRGV